MDYTDQSRKLFANDLFATEAAGIKIKEVRDGFAECEMEITPLHLNAAGFVMGGAIYTLADFTFAVAANAGNPITVTLSSNINFVNASKAPVLYAQAKCVKNGCGVCFFDVTVKEGDGKIIAAVQAEGYRPGQ